jgi:hypothetical protein
VRAVAPCFETKVAFVKMMTHPKDLTPLERYNIAKAYLDSNGFPFLSLPAWGPYSSFATKKQKFRLWSDGIQDELFLESLTKEQASLVIDRLAERQQ